MDVKVIFIAHC